MISALFELIFVADPPVFLGAHPGRRLLMLTAFGVLDTRNRLVWTIGDFLYRVTEPILRPIRNAMPSFGSIDLSPIVVILLLQYIAARAGDALCRPHDGPVEPVVGRCRPA